MTRIIHGDATDLDLLPVDSVDLTVTSPPYNLGKNDDDSKDYYDYILFTKRWLANCWLWTRPTGRLCLNIALDTNKYGKRPIAADVTTVALNAGWRYHSTIIWNEGNISRRTAWGSWKSASAPHIIAPVEVILVLYKDAWKRQRQGESDITADEFKDWVLGV